MGADRSWSADRAWQAAWVVTAFLCTDTITGNRSKGYVGTLIRPQSMLLLKGQICLPCPWLLVPTTRLVVAFSLSYQSVSQTRAPTWLEMHCFSACGLVCGRRKETLQRGRPFFFHWNGSLHLSIFHKDLVWFLDRNTKRLWWSTAFVSVFLTSARDSESLLMCSEGDEETSQTSLPTAWHEVQLILVL